MTHSISSSATTPVIFPPLPQLTKREQQVFDILFHNWGNAVTFRDIIKEIWGDKVKDDRSLRFYIHRLRIRLSHIPIYQITTLNKCYALGLSHKYSDVDYPPIDVVEDITVGDITIRPKSYVCWVRKKLVSLTYTEFKLLTLLMQNSDEVVPHDVIVDSLWTDPVSGDKDVVKKYIHNLRNKISPIEIRSIYGLGYILDSQPLTL